MYYQEMAIFLACEYEGQPQNPIIYDMYPKVP